MFDNKISISRVVYPQMMPSSCIVTKATTPSPNVAIRPLPAPTFQANAIGVHTMYTRTPNNHDSVIHQGHSLSSTPVYSQSVQGYYTPYSTHHLPMMHHHTPATVSAIHPRVHTVSHKDSNNALRAAVFEKVLSSFPQLKKQLRHSENLSEHFHKNSAELSPLFLSSAQIQQKEDNDKDTTLDDLFPTLACDIMEDELDSGYLSVPDGCSPNSTGPGQDSSDFEELDIMSPQLTQMIDDVMDNTPDIVDLIMDIQHGNINKENQPPIQPAPLNFTNSLPQREQNQQKYKCSICYKVMQSESNYKIHMRRHRGVKPFQCGWCDKSFNQRSTLKTHERVHTGERPYKCSFCTKAFADFSTYTKHNRIHTGDKPYSCNVCGKGFAQSGNMIRHQQTHKVQNTTDRLQQLSPLMSMQ